MKFISVASTFLLFVPSVSSTALGECKLVCKEIRPDVLAVKGHCMPAMKQSPTPNLFNACVEGRKKAFDQACTQICTKSEVSVTSFQGCQASVKNKGHKFISWCRKVNFFGHLYCVASSIFKCFLIKHTGLRFNIAKSGSRTSGAIGDGQAG